MNSLEIEMCMVAKVCVLASSAGVRCFPSKECRFADDCAAKNMPLEPNQEFTHSSGLQRSSPRVGDSRQSWSNMWHGCVRASVGRALPPRCCVKAPARLKTARGGSHRRTSTVSARGPSGELVEPDSKVLETLVCPFSKVRCRDRQVASICN